jgi:hypothetical protein
METVRPIIFPEELNKLRGLLKAHNINYKLMIDDESERSPHIQLTVDYNERHFSIIYWVGSYGYSKGLLEIGDLDRIFNNEEGPQVEGDLTAQDCFDIITGKRDIKGQN